MDKKWIWQSENYPHFFLDKSYTIFDFTFDDCLGASFDRLAGYEKKLKQIISQSNLSSILLDKLVGSGIEPHIKRINNAALPAVPSPTNLGDDTTTIFKSQATVSNQTKPKTRKHR